MSLGLLTTTAFEKDLKRVGNKAGTWTSWRMWLPYFKSGTRFQLAADPIRCAATGRGTGIAMSSLIGFCFIG